MAHSITVLSPAGVDTSIFGFYQTLAAITTITARTPTSFTAVSAGGVNLAVTGSGFTYDATGVVSGSYTQAIVNVGAASVVRLNYSPAISIAALNTALDTFIASNFTSRTALDSLFGSQPYTITGNLGDDVLEGLQQNDQLFGGGGNDILIGNAGNDILNPGASRLDVHGNGFDLLIGNRGNDTMNIGTSGASHTIAAYTDDGGPGAINVDLALNSATDTFGNTDTLNGITFVVATTKADTLRGDATNDILAPGTGVDTIDGRGGFDELAYAFLSQFGTDGFNFTQGIVVNHLAAVDNRGTVVDPGLSTDSFSNIERVTGTRFADTFNGGGFADSFAGGDGIDVFRGGGGVDEVFYFAEHAGGGTAGVVVNLVAKTGRDMFGNTDTLDSIENVAGSNFGDFFFGNAVANTFTGNGGVDIINGWFGNDILTGGLGNDFFLFSTAPNSGTNRDTITDFSAPNDTIRLSKAAFTAFSAVTVGSTLSAAAFKANATGTATEPDDRIIYNTANGFLVYDVNGNAAGGATIFAQLSLAPAGVSNLDFVIV